MQYDDDVAFQRAILANPDDVTLKLVYADWLQDRADPRAEYVRLQVAADAPPPAKRKRKAQEQRAKERERLAELGRGLDPVWVAFMRTLARPFVPLKLNWHPPDHPFTEPVGSRGELVMFASQFRTAEAWDAGLTADVEFVVNGAWHECAYGAASCKMYGFVCDLPDGSGPLTAGKVLATIKTADFRSDHIHDLDRTAVPFPGYQPGTANDEIHTDFAHQHMFDVGTGGPGDAEDNGTHGLKSYVADGRIWYVLLHIGPKPCPMVALLAVGRSPHGSRLVGVITSQMCHNLCD